MTKLIVTLVVLAGLVVAADRAGAYYAEKEVAKQAQVQADLGTPPDVTISGVPFLTQAVQGVYDDVTITVEGLQRKGLRVSEVRAELHGAHVPISDAIDGSVDDIPVDKIDATAFLSYHDINAYLAPRHITVSPGPNGELHLQASIVEGTTGVSTEANATLHATGQGLTASAGGLSVTLPLTDLPFELRAVSAHATQTGITTTATATNVDLRSHLGSS